MTIHTIQSPEKLHEEIDYFIEKMQIGIKLSAKEMVSCFKDCIVFVGGSKALNRTRIIDGTPVKYSDLFKNAEKSAEEYDEDKKRFIELTNSEMQRKDLIIENQNIQISLLKDKIENLQKNVHNLKNEKYNIKFWKIVTISLLVISACCMAFGFIAGFFGSMIGLAIGFISFFPFAASFPLINMCINDEKCFNKKERGVLRPSIKI